MSLKGQHPLVNKLRGQIVAVEQQQNIYNARVVKYQTSNEKSNVWFDEIVPIGVKLDELRRRMFDTLNLINEALK